jgi:membrane-associated phospholipid phosphatase
VIPALGAAWLAGRIAGNDRIAGGAVDVGKAIVLAGVATQVLKVSVGRARPAFSNDDVDVYQPFSVVDGYNSFPSGHTAVAFAAATVVADRLRGRWAGRLAYGAATMTAFARINNDKHWFSDVVFGALLGRFAGKLVGGSRLRVVPVTGGPAMTLSF